MHVHILYILNIYGLAPACINIYLYPCQHHFNVNIDVARIGTAQTKSLKGIANNISMFRGDVEQFDRRAITMSPPRFNRIFNERQKIVVLTRR